MAQGSSGKFQAFPPDYSHWTKIVCSEMDLIVELSLLRFMVSVFTSICNSHISYLSVFKALMVRTL